MTRPSWLGRAVKNRHRHAIEQASRRWRGGRRDDSARTRRNILISTQVTGEQAGVDQEALGKAVKRFPKVYATMRPGDVLFTHSNLLHSSAPNESPTWRRSLIVAYNAIDNPPRAGTICPLPAEAPLEPLFDDAEILTRGVVRIDPAREFLDHARNAAQFSAGSN